MPPIMPAQGFVQALIGGEGVPIGTCCACNGTIEPPGFPYIGPW